MTIEEEMNQTRPRRRMDGFSADGLSYSVASDFDKMLGQAMAEFDARRQDPRFVPGARVESPDAPDLLRQELLDPVFAAANAFQGRSVRPATQPTPRMFEMGNQLVSVDPISGQTSVVHSAPQRQDNTARKFKLDQISRQIQGLSALQYDPAKAAMAGMDANKIGAEIERLNMDAEALLAGDAVQPAAPQPSAPNPQMFMGNPSGTNLLNELNLGAAPEYSAAAARKTTNQVTRTLKDGRKAIFDADTKKFIRYAD
jgi:hypothetical protein